MRQPTYHEFGRWLLFGGLGGMIGSTISAIYYGNTPWGVLVMGLFAVVGAILFVGYRGVQ